MTNREALARARAGGVGIVRLPWGRALKGGVGRHRGRVVPYIVKAVATSPETLASWCSERGVPAGWIHRSRSGWWHIDFWGAPAERTWAEEEGALGVDHPALSRQ